MAKRRHRRRYTGPPLTDHLAIGPGDVLELRLGEFDTRGETASEIDGAPAAVTGGIPGELVRAEVVKVFPERVVLQRRGRDRAVPRPRRPALPVLLELQRVPVATRFIPPPT